VRLNLDSLAHPQIVAGIVGQQHAADSEADMEAVAWVQVVVVAAAVRSMSPTFVSSLHIFLCELVVSNCID
jgi:hypothetical protein